MFGCQIELVFGDNSVLPPQIYQGEMRHIDYGTRQQRSWKQSEITHVSTACEGGGGWGGPLGLCAGVREWLMIGKLLLVDPIEA